MAEPDLNPEPEPTGGSPQIMFCWVYVYVEFSALCPLQEHHISPKAINLIPFLWHYWLFVPYNLCHIYGMVQKHQMSACESLETIISFEDIRRG